MKKIFFLSIFASIILLMGLSNCSKKDDNTNSLVADWMKTDSSGTTTYHFVVSSNGSYSGGIDIGSGYTPAVWGTYTNTASTITITDTAGGGSSCIGVPGTYNYSISGNHLVLTVSSDACVTGTPRSSLVSGTWTK